MEIRFSGTSVVVAGASRGLGLAMAKGFAQSGASVAICARGKSGLDSALGELEPYGARILGRVCDLADATGAREVSLAKVTLTSGSRSGDERSAAADVDIASPYRTSVRGTPALRPRSSRPAPRGQPAWHEKSLLV